MAKLLKHFFILKKKQILVINKKGTRGANEVKKGEFWDIIHVIVDFFFTVPCVKFRRVRVMVQFRSINHFVYLSSLLRHTINAIQQFIKTGINSLKF